MPIQPAFLVKRSSNFEHLHRNTWKILTRKAASFARSSLGPGLNPPGKTLPVSTSEKTSTGKYLRELPPLPGATSGKTSPGNYLRENLSQELPLGKPLLESTSGKPLQGTTSGKTSPGKYLSETSPGNYLWENLSRKNFRKTSLRK